MKRNPIPITIILTTAISWPSYSAVPVTLAPTLASEIPLLCNTPTEGTISHPLETFVLSYDAGDNEKVTISVDEDSSDSDPSFETSWRVVDSQGSPAPGRYCDYFNTRKLRTCGPFQAAKSPYKVQVRDSGLNETGSFWVHLQSLTDTTACDRTLLTCGQVFVSMIDHSVDDDLFGACVMDGFRLLITVAEDPAADPSFEPQWRVVDSQGNAAPGRYCDYFNTRTTRDCGPLEAARCPYRIEIQDTGRDQVGAYGVYATSGGCTDCPCPVLELSMETIATSEEFRGCEITAGDAFEIVSPGDVVFRGWRSIVLRNGFSVATGGVFTAVIGVP